MGIEEKTDVLIIGAGSSGIMAADVLLAGIPGIEVKVIEKGGDIGGLPNHCPNVRPNSPHSELLHFLVHAHEKGRIPEAYDDEYRRIVQEASLRPEFAHLGEAARLLYESVLSPNQRFSIEHGKSVRSIAEKGDRYLIEAVAADNGRVSEYEARAVICAQGARPKDFPYPSEGEILDTLEAMNGSVDFEGKRVVVAGAAHTSAVVTANALEGGAEFVRVLYRNKVFPEFLTYGNRDKTVKINRFGGIRETSLGRLKHLREKKKDQYDLVKATNQASAEVGSGWSAVSATGFQSNEITFIRMDESETIATSVNQAQRLYDSLPNLLCLNREPLIGVYGLGMAYPLSWMSGLLPDTVEREGKAIVGTNQTHTLALNISEDIKRLME